MSDSERDPVVRRAIDELRRLPDVDADAMRRVVTAAAAARLAPADDTEVDTPSARRVRGRWSIVAIAAAAAFIGFVLRGEWPATHASQPAVASAGTAPTAATAVPLSAPLPVRAIASSSDDALPVPTQFVFRDGAAHRVAVVGDFNRWNPAAAPMTRSPDGLWSVTLPVLPGRHVYGFMVDGTEFELDPDPRVPRARDHDLGVDASVTIVGAGQP